jgi:hypothetical protein
MLVEFWLASLIFTGANGGKINARRPVLGSRSNHASISSTLIPSQRALPVTSYKALCENFWWGESGKSAGKSPAGLA